MPPNYRDRRIKNHGIGRGGRPGVMMQPDRVVWILDWMEKHGLPVSPCHSRLRLDYAVATKMKMSHKTRPLTKDLIFMHELGLVNRWTVINPVGRTHYYRIAE